MAEVPQEPVDDVVDQLVPLDDEPPTDTEEAATFDDDELLEAEPLLVAEEDQPPIGKSWAFDFVTGRFLPKPSGGPTETRGLATLRYWVEKCLVTERGAYPIHDTNYGLEGVNDMIGEPVDSPEMATLGARVREALTFHPRITDVVGFQVFSDPDEETVYVAFRVVTDEEDELVFDEFAIT